MKQAFCLLIFLVTFYPPFSPSFSGTPLVHEWNVVDVRPWNFNPVTGNVMMTSAGNVPILQATLPNGKILLLSGSYTVEEK